MKRTLIAGLVAMSILGGCSSSPSTNSGASVTGTGTFPVTVTDAAGKVTIPTRPIRIMSLSATATEMLYAIGAGHQVVAVDQYSTTPRNAPRTNLSGYETGAESYLPYHPDLVVLAQSEGAVISQLQALHIPALLLPPANTIADSYSQFAELGKATGHEEGAVTEVSSIADQLTSVAATVGSRAKGATYYQELDPTLYSVASHTCRGASYSSLRMVNIADSAAASSGNQYPQLSAEYLLKANPDYVFLADSVCCGASATSFAARPGFATLKAVRLHHVFAINDSTASQWGPNIVTFLQIVAHDVTSASK